MEPLNFRLFIRIITRSPEVYALKIITLAIAFACSALITLFALNEFGYDRFHKDYHSVFRVLQRNTSETHSGNRLSNKVPTQIHSSLKQMGSKSLTVSRVKLMKDVNMIAGTKVFNKFNFYAADRTITEIFSFEIDKGALTTFFEGKQNMLINVSAATKYFGTTEAIGNEIKVSTGNDTVVYRVAAVFKDFPDNSHEDFNCIVPFDEASLDILQFNYEAGMYGRIRHGAFTDYEKIANKLKIDKDLTFIFQPISEIYFGPRVMGEDSRHGDHYSIIILVCINLLILFLAMTTYINLTTLSLPNRSKELAIKKLAGTPQSTLVAGLLYESFLLVGFALLLGIIILASLSTWFNSTLGINPFTFLLKGNLSFVAIIIAIFIATVIAPVFISLRFTRATPNRLLSTDTITFPKFKKNIAFLQLGLSIFLIVCSVVMRRQISYSLLKEPGRNYDQIVHLDYPEDLDNEELANLRYTWRKNHPNILDLMATSQLPNQVSSKEIDSDFFRMSVNPEFAEFFNLNLVSGNWFKANDGDSIVVVNESGSRKLGSSSKNVIGVFKDINSQYNQPERPLKINVAPYYHYNYLCIRILEVDIRKTVEFLSNHFANRHQKAKISFFDTRFEEWVAYQDRLNKLSAILAIISGLLSCCAIYGLSISIVRDKLKQIAIHKLCGADTFNIVMLLFKELLGHIVTSIFVFGPLTYLFLREVLRNFVYRTEFRWIDPILPLAYCTVVIMLLCGFQALSLNRTDLSKSLKG